MNQNNQYQRGAVNNQPEENVASSEKIQDVQRNARLEKDAHASAGKASLKNNRGVPAGGVPANNSRGRGLRNQPRMATMDADSSSKNNRLNAFNKNRNNFANNIQQAKQAIAKEALKKYAAAHGIPENVTEKVLNSKMGQKALDMALNGQDPFKHLKELNPFLSDSEKSLSEKSDDREQEKVQSGTISAEFSLKTIRNLVILTPVISIIIFLLIITVTAHSESQVSKSIFADMVSEGLISDVDEVYDMTTGFGSENPELAVGMGNNKYPAEYYERLSSLGNIYSTQAKCEGEECLERSEFLYYLKVADMANRYKNKYNVKLDWALIVATDLYFAEDTEKLMEANLSNYDKNNVENYDVLSELDWDNDFKNMPGYNYLDSGDSRYDLNILAKNMVKKKTTQNCLDGNGNVVKTQVDEDVEDMYFASGSSKRLVCGSGQKYSIHSTYSLDMDKYDAFLLEYIDLKSRPSSSSGNTISNGKYIFPLPSDSGYRLTSPFGYRIHPISGKQELHNGTDFGVAGGTPVYAIADGTVILSKNGYNGGAGNYIKIDHGNGVISIYMHASALKVTKDTKVKQGDVIMLVGTTGASTGNHLHIGISVNGAYIDPVTYIGTGTSS